MEHTNINWPCENQEKHEVKTHPSDVVFWYEEPYSQSRTYVNCDLSREDLISAISLLPHDYHDLNTLLEQREHSGRQEKLTSVTLPEALTIEEIKEVLREYTAESPPDERVTFHAKGNDQVLVTVKFGY